MKHAMAGMTLGLFMLAGCATTDDAAGTDTANAAAGSDRECRAVGGGTGTRMRQSVCRTKEEWAVADARAKEQEDLQAEFFRRVGENASQTSAPAFDSPTGL